MIDTQSWTMEKLYQAVLNKQLGGVMFHSDARLFMAFLGLTNGSEMQKLRQEDESETLDRISMRYLECHGMMLQAQNTERVEFISAEAYKTQAQEVGAEYKRKMLTRFMDLWADWEKKTAELYSAAVDWCLKKQEPDYLFFEKLLKGVQKERLTLENLRRYFRLTGYDLSHCESAVRGFLCSD